MRDRRGPAPRAGTQRGAISFVGLFLAIALAGLVIWQSAPHETVAAVIVDSRFVPERGTDGHTRITLQTTDGRTLTAKRPGRHAWKTGDLVTTEIAGSRVLRIRAPESGPPTG